MTAISDLIDPADRARLLERLADLEANDRLIRQPGTTRPPDPPPSLVAVANASGPHKAGREAAGVTARQNGVHQ